MISRTIELEDAEVYIQQAMNVVEIRQENTIFNFDGRYNQLIKDTDERSVYLNYRDIPDLIDELKMAYKSWRGVDL